jgi:hypothetical protein
MAQFGRAKPTKSFTAGQAQLSDCDKLSSQTYRCYRIQIIRVDKLKQIGDDSSGALTTANGGDAIGWS